MTARRRLTLLAIIALFAALLALMGPGVAKGWRVCSAPDAPGQCPGEVR